MLRCIGLIGLCIVLTSCATRLNGWDGQRCGFYSQEPETEAITALTQGVTDLAAAGLPGVTPGAQPSRAPITSPPAALPQVLESCVQAQTCVYYHNPETQQTCVVSQGQTP